MALRLGRIVYALVNLHNTDPPSRTGTGRSHQRCRCIVLNPTEPCIRNRSPCEIVPISAKNTVYGVQNEFGCRYGAYMQMIFLICTNRSWRIDPNNHILNTKITYLANQINLKTILPHSNANWKGVLVSNAQFQFFFFPPVSVDHGV